MCMMSMAWIHLATMQPSEGFTVSMLGPQPGGGNSAGPRTPATPAPPPPPQGAFGQHLVAKAVAPRRTCEPQAPDAP